jgi:hypothetical protein
MMGILRTKMERVCPTLALSLSPEEIKRESVSAIRVSRSIMVRPDASRQPVLNLDS